MDGLTISNGNKFLETGGLRDTQGTSIELKRTLPTQDSSSVQKSFSDTLNEAIGSVNELQKASDSAAQNLASGRTDNIQEVMIASEKADIALKLMVQVRNKIIDAYQEIMKMQV